MSFDGSTIGAATTATFTSGVIADTFSVGSADVDMFKVELVAGEIYEVDVDNGGDFYLRIFDANGNEVIANDDGSRATDDVVSAQSPYVRFVANYSGAYYIAISPYYLDSYDPFTTAGRFSPENPLPNAVGEITITNIGTAAFPSVGAINAIATESISDLTDALRDEDQALRAEFTGGINTANDVDIARMDLAKGDIIVIDVNGEAGTVLRVFGGTGVQIGFDDDSGTGGDSELIFAAPLSDDYYVAISGDGNTA